MDFLNKLSEELVGLPQTELNEFGPFGQNAKMQKAANNDSGDTVTLKTNLITVIGNLIRQIDNVYSAEKSVKQILDDTSITNLQGQYDAAYSALVNYYRQHKNAKLIESAWEQFNHKIKGIMALESIDSQKNRQSFSHEILGLKDFYNKVIGVFTQARQQPISFTKIGSGDVSGSDHQRGALKLSLIDAVYFVVINSIDRDADSEDDNMERSINAKIEDVKKLMVQLQQAYKGDKLQSGWVQLASQIGGLPKNAQQIAPLVNNIVSKLNKTDRYPALKVAANAEKESQAISERDKKELMQNATQCLRYGVGLPGYFKNSKIQSKYMKRFTALMSNLPDAPQGWKQLNAYLTDLTTPEKQDKAIEKYNAIAYKTGYGVAIPKQHQEKVSKPKSQSNKPLGATPAAPASDTQLSDTAKSVLQKMQNAGFDKVVGTTLGKYIQELYNNDNPISPEDVKAILKKLATSGSTNEWREIQVCNFLEEYISENPWLFD